MDTLATLTARYTQAGQLDWIGLRPDRLADPVAVTAVDMTEAGLVGDHARPGKRALGPGGYTAMRGHGGWCARVVTPGTVQLGDQIRPDVT